VHPLRAWVDALEVLLRPREDVELVAAHTDLAWGRHAVALGEVHVLLLHLGAVERGLEKTLHELFEARPDLSVVALSDSRDPALISTVVRAGARGWLDQSASVEHLVRVLVGVARGEGWIPPDLLGPVLDHLVDVGRTRQHTSDAFASLTTREIDVLRALTQGLSRQEIAEKYTLSPHTVRTHINHVLHKLDVHSTLAAVSLARRVGLDEDVSHHRRPRG
jgi:DNA-binding NarL/FixJ family response regulator